VHIHLIDFLLLRRVNAGTDLWVDYDPLVPNGSPGTKFTVIGTNPDGLRPWEVDAAKDVIHLGPSHELYVLTFWGPNAGDYMFHCHNLVHEGTFV
jgi:FtsP/CotA-like multicopper oxidase with cupredoxin domain